MKTFVTVVALTMATAGIANAQSSHDHSGQGQTAVPSSSSADQSGMMQEMMPMMMEMHKKMMGGGMMGGGMMGGGMKGGGMMEGGSANLGAMMDRDAMKMMMGGGMMGGGMMKGQTPEDMRSTALDRLKEFDSDGSGDLSLAEFEALYAAMMREAMVDRFQHLDADGDGKITKDEMAAPAQRMGMRMMQKPSDEEGENKPSVE